MILTGTQKELATRMNVGLVFWCERKPDKAVEHYQDLLNEFRAFGDSLLLAKLHNNLGIAFYLKAEMSGDESYFHKTITEYKNAQRYLNLIDDLPTIGIVENNIGNVRLQLGQIKDAHAHLNIAEEILLSFNDEALLGIVWETRARVFLAEGEMKKAKQAIDRSEQLLLNGVEVWSMAETQETKKLIDGQMLCARRGKPRGINA